MKEDRKTMDELKRDIVTAQNISYDLEALLWEILKDYTFKNRDHFILDNSVEFGKIGAEFEKNFKTNIGVIQFKEARGKSIGIIEKFEKLQQEYFKISSKIKTHYDTLYEIRPNQRYGILDDLDLVDLLPPALVSEWKDNQRNIEKTYTKDKGLKTLLSKATGKVKREVTVGN